MKYIIELEDKPVRDLYGENENNYKCKQIPYWYLPESLVNRLTPYTESDREVIENEVWEFVNMIARAMTTDDRIGCFQCGTGLSVVHEMTYQEAKDRYEEWKKQKDDNAIKQKVIDLADEIGVHKLYAIVRDIRGE